jgi:hypothetical protein
MIIILVLESLSQHLKTCCTDPTFWDKDKEMKATGLKVYSHDILFNWIYLYLSSSEAFLSLMFLILRSVLISSFKALDSW